MIETAISFALGLVLGGFGVSACWGLFWSGFALVGALRGTSKWQVVRASLTAGLVPLLMVVAVVWMMDGARAGTWPFLLGLAGVPVALLGLGLRKLPDGTRVGERLVGGARTMMDTMMGRHSGCGDCGGCGEEHHH
ncbi:hypothetical protein [Nitrospira lenta]|uniref:Uncharacterized protein n=1 Tax=Nitrospira lenta TaxID=1436998 RepID=A0A330L785_9BACT|nr:hypothetical protein [Nitrospira lenta]SPP65800.1 conserved membrane hypothetical protein [Nitrospira lenta]